MVSDFAAKHGLNSNKQQKLIKIIDQTLEKHQLHQPAIDTNEPPTSTIIAKQPKSKYKSLFNQKPMVPPNRKEARTGTNNGNSEFSIVQEDVLREAFSDCDYE